MDIRFNDYMINIMLDGEMTRVKLDPDERLPKTPGKVMLNIFFIHFCLVTENIKNNKYIQTVEKAYKNHATKFL